MSMRRKVEEGKHSDFAIRNDGALVIGSRLCVPTAEELKGRYWGRPTVPLMLCTPVVPRCTVR